MSKKNLSSESLFEYKKQLMDLRFKDKLTKKVSSSEKKKIKKLVVNKIFKNEGK